MNEPIFFKSPAHKARFIGIMQNIGKVYEAKTGWYVDQDYGAALYILTAYSGIWQKTQYYVEPDGILFNAMLAEVDFGSGHRLLVRLASNLFNGGVHKNVYPVELCYATLDEENFKVALSALYLRRYSYSIDDFKE